MREFDRDFTSFVKVIGFCLAVAAVLCIGICWPESKTKIEKQECVVKDKAAEITVSEGILDNLYFIYHLREDIDRGLALEIALHVHYYSRYYGLNPKLILAKIEVESGFDPNAENDYSGATGLMQIMPTVWADELGVSRKDLFNPRINIREGTYIFDHYLRFFGGDIDLAIVAYYQGPEKTMKDIDFGEIENNMHLFKVKRVLEELEDL